MAATEPRDNLLQGIFAKWTATSLATSIPTRAQGDRDTSTNANPASGTHFPYAVVMDGDRSFRTGSTCGNDYFTHPVRIRVYHNSYAEAAALAKLVNDVFRPKSLTLTLPAGSLVKNRYEGVTYKQESKGVHYAELRYEFETSFPVQA